MENFRVVNNATALGDAEDLLMLLTHISNQNHGNLSFGVDWSFLRNYPYLQEELLVPLVLRVGWGPQGREYFFGSSAVKDFDRVSDFIQLLEIEIAARTEIEHGT